jgi:hypothetical protein
MASPASDLNCASVAASTAPALSVKHQQLEPVAELVEQPGVLAGPLAIGASSIGAPGTMFAGEAVAVGRVQGRIVRKPAPTGGRS